MIDIFKRKPKPPQVRVVQNLPEDDPTAIKFMPNADHGFYVDKEGQHYHVGLSFAAGGYMVGVAVKCDKPEDSQSCMYIYEHPLQELLDLGQEMDKENSDD